MARLLMIVSSARSIDLVSDLRGVRRVAEQLLARRVGRRAGLRAVHRARDGTPLTGHGPPCSEIETTSGVGNLALAGSSDLRLYVGRPALGCSLARQTGVGRVVVGCLGGRGQDPMPWVLVAGWPTRP